MVPAALAAVTVLAGCTAPTGSVAPTATSVTSATTGPTTRVPSRTAAASTDASPSASRAAATRRVGAAPRARGTYEVRTRSFRVTRDDRVIEVTAWYPAATRSGGFPVVLFSHGLTALPSDYRALTTSWASRGVVVVAPRYPFTHRGAPSLQPADLLNQPADATAVLDQVLRLARTVGDPFRNRVDAGHVVAAGHSLGGITTVGLFSSCCRDPRLRGGIVLAGNDIGFTGWSGTAVPLLFVHGDADPLVPYSSARSTYETLPWPKAFVTLKGQGHTVPFTEDASSAGALVESMGAAFVAAVARNESPWARVRATVGKASGVELESVSPPE